jgi:hypothetical protein
MEKAPWTFGNAGALPAGCPTGSSQIHIKLHGSTANTNVCIPAMPSGAEPRARTFGCELASIACATERHAGTPRIC